MVVVNIVGFTYKVRLNSGRVLVIPNDNRPHEVPDELTELFTGKNYDNVFRVLVPPSPKVIIKQTTTEILEPPKKAEIIEISLEDDEEKSIEKKEEVDKKPLKGKKIKAKKRKSLTKKRATKEE